MVPDNYIATIGSYNLISELRNGSTRLLLLPNHLLKRILQESGSAAVLRFVSKAFADTVAKTITRVTLPRGVIRNYGQLRRVFNTFPDANQAVLDLSTDFNNFDHSNSIWSAEDVSGDAVLVAGALDALAALRHPLVALAILHLSCRLTLPSTSTLAYLASCGLTELELQDVSIQRAASDGASNLLRPPPPFMPDQLPAESLADSIRARGTAMVRFACSLPSLRRLSLCSAAFSASDVSALAGLTQLEELSLIGAMECGGPAGSAPSGPSQSELPKLVDALAAVPTYKHLLAALPRLRRLRLPMPIASSLLKYRECRTGTLLDSDDEDGGVGINEESGADCVFDNQDFWRFFHYSSRISSELCGSPGPFSAPTAQFILRGGNRDPVPVNTASSTVPAAAGWDFPPQLEELTIPLCSLNGPMFRAVCEAYAGRALAGEGGSGGNCASAVGARQVHRRLRSLHVTCAPGYTAWEGSFLNVDSDFSVMACLGPTLESLHLSLELHGWGRNALRKAHLRDCLRPLRMLHRLQDLCITETRQPLCFATRRAVGFTTEAMSYLMDKPQELPRRCADVRIPPMASLGDLQPLAAAPRNSRTGWPVQVARSQLPVACLDSLLLHWPQLRTLSVCGQCAIRSTCDGQTRLVRVEDTSGRRGGL